ncbi:MULTISPECIES: hypothetical protein [unclassified Rhizobium]|uniref:hypothetical protein n=1 Tax=unclassified Rhizobium TaxID=2613769 RepID=UPI001FCDE105|nr:MULTISPECIES: hypothetical protein [unclassified Rhizobium]MDM9623277.1 hypothetical protein [Rhizobium sp. S96]
MLNGSNDRYVELTTRIRSIEAFCDFLTHGGTVRVAASDGKPFVDVTSQVLVRQTSEADKLRQIRRQLFPERTYESARPAPCNSH